MESNVYDYYVIDSHNQQVPIKNFAGKVILIVNTATGCGFTPQYEPLEKMYKELKLYTFLKSQKGFNGFDQDNKLTKVLEEMLSKADPDYAKKSDIKWNFTKFVIDRKGNVVARFEPTADMNKVRKCIEELI